MSHKPRKREIRADPGCGSRCQVEYDAAACVRCGSPVAPAGYWPFETPGDPWEQLHAWDTVADRER